MTLSLTSEYVPDYFVKHFEWLGHNTSWWSLTLEFSTAHLWSDHPRSMLIPVINRLIHVRSYLICFRLINVSKPRVKHSHPTKEQMHTDIIHTGTAFKCDNIQRSHFFCSAAQVHSHHHKTPRETEQKSTRVIWHDLELSVRIITITMITTWGNFTFSSHPFFCAVTDNWGEGVNFPGQ